MRIASLALILLALSHPAAAQEGPRQTQSTTKRAPSPPGFDAAFEKGDFEGAFIILAPAIIGCVKAQTVQDECLDLILVGTTTASRANALDVAETLAEQAVKVAEAGLPDTDSDRLIATRNMASILDKRGRAADALAWHREALALADRQLAPDAAAIGAELRAIVAAMASDSDLRAREAVERRLLAWSERGEPQNVATYRADLALILKQQGRHEAAEVEYAQAERLFTQQLGATHKFTLTARLARIVNLEAGGRLREALPLLVALAAVEPADEYNLRYLGRLQIEAGDYAASEAAYRRAIEVNRAGGRDSAGLLADSLGGLGTAMDARGRYAEAERYAREAAAAVADLPQERERYLRALNNIATAVMSQGRYAEAEGLFRNLVAQRRGGDPVELATVLSNLSLTLLYQGKDDAALGAQREALALRQANLPKDSPSVALSQGILADLEEERNGPAAALSLRRAAYATYMAKAGPDHPQTAAAGQALALALAYSRLEFREAVRLLRDARRVMAARLDPDAYDRIVNGSYLAISLDMPRQAPEVRALLKESTAGIQQRIARMRDFGPVAQREMRRFRPIFELQVKTNWQATASPR